MFLSVIAVVRWALLVFVFVLLLGAFIGFFELGFQSLLGYPLPDWSPVQYVGAAFAMGFIYVIGEIVWHPIGQVLVDADKATDSLWKRLLRVLILILIGMLPIVAYMVWQLRLGG
jgi:hypothetical protein